MVINFENIGNICLESYYLIKFEIQYQNTIDHLIVLCAFIKLYHHYLQFFNLFVLLSFIIRCFTMNLK